MSTFNQTAKFLAILLLSSVFTGVLSIPFINLLYKLKFRDPETKSEDFLGQKTIFNKLQRRKVGIPVGGGILILVSTFLFSTIFYALTHFKFNWTSNILFLTLASFGLLGFLDDLSKFFDFRRTRLFGLRIRYKLLIQLVLGLAIGGLLYSKMDLQSLWFPFGISINLGRWFIPFAALIIVATSNAFNITDGLDGLAGGLLMITLVPFWYLANFSPFGGDIVLFIAVLWGSLLVFLYFNIHPARVFMGDTGALALGALLGVVALMVDRALALPIIGGVFVVEALSTLLQWGSMFFRDGRRVFKIAPFHHHLEAVGWGETKIVMRLWLASIFLAILGTLVASL